MAVTQIYSISAVTVGTTELSIVSGTTTLANDTTAGAYELVADASNMAKGDEFAIDMYEKALSGGTKRQFVSFSLMGVQSELFISPTFLLMWGWDMTIRKIAGVDRAFTASIRKAG